MDVVYNLIVVTHFLGLAALIGGYAAGQPKVNEVMVWGARLQIVTGVILVGLAESIDSLGKDPDMAKIGTKLVISLVVAAFAEIGHADAKKGKDVPWMTHAAGGLGIVNVMIAVLWT
ncbi:hypothetical protein [Nocardia shimofusensis]|uniref:hypothetical protein n=1 Tax=Nocardia shimofusensis TaxID=228596 RepID=UPI00082FF7D4|nr:hypothetical protein [Nocardia shimofusensis]